MESYFRQAEALFVGIKPYIEDKKVPEFSGKYMVFKVFSYSCIYQKFSRYNKIKK